MYMSLLNSSRAREIWAARAFEFALVSLAAFWRGDMQAAPAAPLLLLALLPVLAFVYRWQLLPALVALAARLVLAPSSSASTCIGVAGSLLSAILCVLMRLPILPPLRGPYKVGTCKVNLTDSRRQRWPQAPWLAPGPRMLPTMIWYPATGGAAYKKCPRSAFLRHRAKRIRMASEFKMPSFLLAHFNQWRCRSRVGPPPAQPLEGSAGFPVVIFSSGWLAMRESNSLLAEELAAQGYVVMSCDHVGDTPLTTHEEDSDAGVACAEETPPVGLLVYMGHSNFREWHAARGWPGTAHPKHPGRAGHGGAGMDVGVSDLANIANLIHGDELDADGLPVIPNGRLWDVEAPAKGGIGWNAAVRKHAALPMAEAMVRLQAFRRSQLKLRAGDFMFLLDAIEQLNTSTTLPGPGGTARAPPCAALAALAGRIDTSRTLACGQSFGGATAIMSAACDKRFTGVVAFDPWMWTLPGHGASLRRIFPSDRAHASAAAAALACEPPAEALLGRHDGSVGGADDQTPIALRCPAIFVGCERMWRPEISGEDVFGIDNRREVASLAARASPPAALLYLDRANHFDLTDLTTYAPGISTALGFTSPIHRVAGEYAAQELMLESVLACAASAAANSSAPPRGKGPSQPAKAGSAPSPKAAMAPLKEELSGHSRRFPGYVLLGYDELKAREGEPPYLSLDDGTCGDGSDTSRASSTQGRTAAAPANGNAKAERRSRSPAARQPTRPDEGSLQKKVERQAEVPPVPEPEPVPVPWLFSLVEVVLTFLLPVALVLLVIAMAGKRGLPGKPGDDLKLHRLAV
jgi:predicted dienelactone hydrolase